ncbi:unnamed protein product [Albugo candida]|uniref:Uncharacterized protein n=1 Tax=Albugo candida TaxID=65357 RepID=A0A024FWY9_9STRA|nr:unnamed protein product [Albugo candida]|eukprot:CCI11179.1 unnamed protein product [Albugo candida]
MASCSRISRSGNDSPLNGNDSAGTDSKSYGTSMLQKDARQYSHSGCCLLGLSNLTKSADEKSVHIKRRQNWSYSSVYLFCRNVGVKTVEWAWCIHRRITIDEGVRGHDLCAHCCRRGAINSNWNPAKGFEEYNCGDSSLEPACLKALAAVT